MYKCVYNIILIQFFSLDGLINYTCDKNFVQLLMSWLNCPLLSITTIDFLKYIYFFRNRIPLRNEQIFNYLSIISLLSMMIILLCLTKKIM